MLHLNPLVRLPRRNADQLDNGSSVSPLGLCIIKRGLADFSGGPVVETSPSNAGGAYLIPGWELSSHVPRGQRNIKQKQYCNKFSKDIKMVNIRKKKKTPKNFNKRKRLRRKKRGLAEEDLVLETE